MVDWMGQNMFSLVSRKFLAMRKIALYSVFFFSNRSVSTADAPNWDQLGSSLRKFSFITDNIGNLIGSPGRRPSMPAPSMESESIQRKG